MTSDPKAPDAPAVYLYREEETDFSNHYISKYARIKVLTAAGCAWSKVEIAYDPAVMMAPIIEGRTIHADGSVVPISQADANPRPDNVSLEKLQKVTFILPQVTVGSVLEYRWTLRIAPKGNPRTRAGYFGNLPYYWSPLQLNAPRWEVQADIYTHEAKFQFDPFDKRDKNDRQLLNNDGFRTEYVDGERAENLLYVDR